MKNCWNEIEYAAPETLRRLQEERLQRTVRRVYDNVPWYRERMQKADVVPGDIRTLEDLAKLPFTKKVDLRDNYPFGTFAVPMDDVVRIHASSGTTGHPTVVGYTKNDLEMWSECMARSLSGVGVTKKDVVHIAYGYGLFTGGLGAHAGSERIGAATVPASVGNTQRQIMLLRDFGATVLCCTPSYALHLADEIEKAGLTKNDLKLRVGVFGAEPWTEEMRAAIEERLGIRAYDIYGLSEILGPSVAMDCEEKCGMHIQSDHFIPEIINPETGEQLPDGEVGELVFSCVTKEALPLLRYRTGDLASLITEPCACGRTTPRLGKIRGRADDMLIIRGVNVFPSQIEAAILKFKEVEPHYMIYVDRRGPLDTLEIEVELGEKLFADEIRSLEGLQKSLRHEIESTLGIAAEVRLVGPHSIPRSEGKAKRVIDRRKL